MLSKRPSGAFTSHWLFRHGKRLLTDRTHRGQPRGCEPASPEGMRTCTFTSGCRCPPELNFRLMVGRPKQALQFTRDLKQFVRAALEKPTAP